MSKPDDEMSEPDDESTPEDLPAVVIQKADDGTDWFAVITSVGLSLALTSIPGGAAVKTVIETIVERQRQRASQTIVEVADIVGGGDLLMQRMEEVPELRDLLARSVEAAIRSSNEAKRRLLVKAVANAFQNDEAIDPAILTELALAQLEPVHIRTLTKLVEHSDSLGPWPDEDTDAHAHHERTTQMMKLGEQIPQPVLVTLVNAGVVMQSTNVFGGGTHLHDVSPFGREIIRGLQNEG